ncbi:MAG: GAF domain-containing sensor histidine kinase [Streptosporangiaceae bacterium]
MRIRAPARKAAEEPGPSALPRRVRLLLDASLALSTEQDLDVLLRRFTAIACELIDASYGALLVEDIGTLVTFVTHGMTEEQHALIGEPPSRTGLHGELLRDGKTVVIDDLLSDPRTTGYPAHHPAMRSFLGTPIRAGARVIGELYLADKRNGRRFDNADVEIIEALAATAGVAYRNARLLRVEQRSAAHAQALLDLRAKGNLDEMVFWSQVWAREEERARLARDIHDEQGQILTSLILFAKHLEQQVDREIAPQVSGLRELAEQALRAARTLAQQLRPLELDQLGLVPALNRLVEHTAQRCGVAVDFVAGPQQVRLAYALEVVVYRIAQQALTNVARHSRAHSASVTLSGREGWLTLIIEDDGVGFDCDAVLTDARDGAHTGIRTMRDRARSIGGDLVVESDRGSGTLVRLRVPASGEPASGEPAPSEYHTPARPRPVPRRRASRLDGE